MDSYIKYVTKCRKRKKTDIIENSSQEHAEILTKEIILFATKNRLSIRIISGSLYKRFWEPMKEALENYFEVMEDEANLEVIIINPYNEEIREAIKLDENPIYKLFKEQQKKNDKVKIHIGINKKIVINQTHFVLAGKQAYRQEPSQCRAIAVASFNDKIEGKWLFNSFDFIRGYINNPTLIGAAHNKETTSPLDKEEVEKNQIHQKKQLKKLEEWTANPPNNAPNTNNHQVHKHHPLVGSAHN